MLNTIDHIINYISYNERRLCKITMYIVTWILFKRWCKIYMDNHTYPQTIISTI